MSVQAMTYYVDYTWFGDEPFECQINHRSTDTAVRCLKRGFSPYPDDELVWGIVVRYEDDIPREVVGFAVREEPR